MIAAAPSAMKMPRSTMAITMPIISADCWYFSGTANLAMISRKMKRLSTEREYSVSQPAKYSPANLPPAKYQMPRPKRIAAPT